MLKFGNKEFRNLQEQVLENMKDIVTLKEGTAVLDEFGIKVVGEVDSLADLPTVAEYKEAHEDWAYGDAFAVGTEAPYALYILTRENDSVEEDHWFDIGEFPMPGPQGPQGIQGPAGPQGQQGNTGAAAGFGVIDAQAQTLSPGSLATVLVNTSGPDTAKSIYFTFGIPRGADGEGGLTPIYIVATRRNVAAKIYDFTLSSSDLDKINDNKYNCPLVISIREGQQYQPELLDTFFLTAEDTLNSQLKYRNVEYVEEGEFYPIGASEPIYKMVIGYSSVILNSSTGVGYLTVDESSVSKAGLTGSYNDLTDKPDIDSIAATAANAVNIANDAASEASNASYVASNAYTAANNAGTVANNALSTANHADSMADLAYTTATGAQSVANSASVTANNAANAAQSAHNAANSAASSASSALSAAQSAYNAANDASNAAASVSGLAQDAMNAANSASADASSAVSAAASAMNAANDASSLAQAAYDAANSIVVPTKTSDLENDSGFITGVSWSEVTGKPTFATVATTGDYDDLTDKPDLSVYELATDAANIAAVANSAASAAQAAHNAANDASSLAQSAYDAANAIVVPTKTSDLVNDSGYITGVSWSEVTDKPTFATVATSGDYDDLLDKPDLSVYELATDAANIAAAAQAAHNAANDASSLAQSAFNAANGAASDAANASSLAQSAYDAANSAASDASNASALSQSAYDAANSAQSAASSASSLAQNAYDAANSATSAASNASSLAQAAYDAANAIDVPTIDNKTIVENLSGQIETAAGGWKESVPTEITTLSMPWGTYGQYVQYLASVNYGTATTEQIAADYTAWMTYLNEKAGGDIINITIMLSVDGSIWDEYAATASVYKTQYPRLRYFTCAALGLSSVGDFRIQDSLGQEFFSPGSQLVGPNQELYAYAKLKVIGPGSIVYHTIDNNYIDPAIVSGAALGATAVQPGSLATVATSGSYNDLSDKPTIPECEIEYVTTSSTDADISMILANGKIPVYKDGTYVLPYVYTNSIGYCFGGIVIDRWFSVRKQINGVWESVTPNYPVTTSRTINGKALSSNITLDASDIGISGLNDGTNWTSLTIGSDTYGLAGGGSSAADYTDVIKAGSVGNANASNNVIYAYGSKLAITANGTNNASNAPQNSITISNSVLPVSSRYISHNVIIEAATGQNDFVGTTAGGGRCVVVGTGIKFNSDQTIVGRWNIADTSGAYEFIIGNGTSNSVRSNALTLSKTGVLEVPNMVLSDGTNSVSVADLAALITYAKGQG